MMIFAVTPVRRLRMLACVVLGCVAFSQTPAKRPLTVGIKRNQQELQGIVGMINENKKEQAWVLTEVFADATSLVTAGALKHVDDAERVSKLLEVIKNAASTTGKLTDFADAADDFKNGDLGLKVSDALKELLDLLGSNPALVEIGIASNVTDLGIKASQWRALQVENDELLKVVAKLTAAQNHLLARDPATRARIEAAARKASQGAAERQRTQAELLRQYYKDKPRAIQLAVRQAAARGPGHAFQVAQGISIVDPDHSVGDLAGMPGINPDFIEALKRCNQTVATAWTRQGYQDAMTCNKYSDGSYINIFGPSRRGLQPRPSNANRHSDTKSLSHCGASASESPSCICQNMVTHQASCPYNKCCRNRTPVAWACARSCPH